ncbi:glycosyltransferase family 2 protein, partial [Candidatus Saccharibacteria bacterium]|nr:glycosyltransferase family 2 protein [Candidatus Saccharibacteria bacterium]
METPLISVIIPVYNVKPYIRDCIESILRQSYPKMEIILIDDGSTDGSGADCDAFART